MARLNPRTLGLAIGLSVLCGPAGADDNPAGMKPPKVVRAQIDWAVVLKTLDALPELRAAAPDGERPQSAEQNLPALIRLNDVMSSRFLGIAVSPVPVLLPLDIQTLLRGLAAAPATDDTDRYLSGFHANKFFYAGPSGYDAAFTLQVSEIPEFTDVKLSESIEVQISASSLLYELEGPTAVGQPVPELEAEFPGIKRLLYELHLRYIFELYGVSYVVSIGCFDGGRPRYRIPTCRVADRVALRFLRALRFTGGTPPVARTVAPLPIARPAEVSSVFRYRSPGKLLAGTSFRDQGGRADYTVYSPIRFPLAHAPAYINTQVFQRRNPTPGFDYPWRDNFCERRSFPVGQCPAGIGHQGEDIRPAPCSPQPCHPYDQIVAVHDGMILRSPRQEAAYLLVNTATEHIRFRYLHMSPRQMNADGLLSGRLVREGDVIGEISNFSNRENGTSYHLHFDVQVPTRDGWVFVNPYMTLVAAYERLTGGRGTEVDDAVIAATGEPDKVIAIDPPPRHAKFSRADRHRHGIRGHRNVSRHVLHGPRHRKLVRHRIARR